MQNVQMLAKNESKHYKHIIKNKGNQWNWHSFTISWKFYDQKIKAK